MALSGLWAGCAASTAQQSAENYQALSHSKARSDLLYQGARERVLLASYAAQVQDHSRAARWFQQAWCLDPESVYLNEKIALYQELTLISSPPRCYPNPRTRSAIP